MLTTTARYQRQRLYAEQGSVRTHYGLDPLTGLPVLIYQFPGKPTLRVGDLESANIPGVLASSFVDGEGQVVVAYASEYHGLQEPVAADRVKLLLEHSTKALSDAATAGVTHGDIRPERFLLTGDHLLLEGFGVRWDAVSADYRPPEQEGLGYAADVYAWAKSVQFLCGEHLPARLAPLLETCLQPDPDARPLAREIHDTVIAAESTALSPADESAFDLELDFGDTFTLSSHDADKDTDIRDIPKQAESDVPVMPPRKGFSSPTNTPESSVTPSRPDDANQRAPEQSDANAAKPAAPAAWKADQPPASAAEKVPTIRHLKPRLLEDNPGFVKDLPPGATYRSGRDTSDLPPASFEDKDPLRPADRQRGNRRLALLIALIIGVALLGYLAFMRQGAAPLTSAKRDTTQYKVNVSLEPNSLRYVSLLVIDSPPGSVRETGDEVATIPGPTGPLVLDAAGVWQLQASFQDMRSEVVTFTVPEDRSVTFTLLEPEASIGSE